MNAYNERVTLSSEDLHGVHRDGVMTDTISLNDTERVAVDGEDEVSVLGRRLSIRYIRSSSPHTQEMDTTEGRHECDANARDSQEFAYRGGNGSACPSGHSQPTEVQQGHQRSVPFR